MGKFIDLTGRRFGRLVALERAANTASGNRRWLCQCDCGQTVIIGAADLRSGHSKSCGCLRRELSTRHGLARDRIHRIWRCMIRRCFDSKHGNFHNYGGRGITVCEEWRHSFEAFARWAFDTGYNESLTLERIDTNKPYSPKNCCWATMKEQQRNRRNNRLVKGKPLAQWAEEARIPFNKLSRRLRSGKSLGLAIMSA